MCIGHPCHPMHQLMSWSTKYPRPFTYDKEISCDNAISHLLRISVLCRRTSSRFWTVQNYSLLYCDFLFFIFIEYDRCYRFRRLQNCRIKVLP